MAYAVAILGENLYQRALLSEGAGGRPALPLTVAGAAAAAASAVLVGGSGGAGPGASLGLVVGAVGALGTLFVSVNRVKNVKSDPFVSCFFFVFRRFQFSFPSRSLKTFFSLFFFFFFCKPKKKKNAFSGLARTALVARVHVDRELCDGRGVCAGVSVRRAAVGRSGAEGGGEGKFLRNKRKQTETEEVTEAKRGERERGLFPFFPCNFFAF